MEKMDLHLHAPSKFTCAKNDQYNGKSLEEKQTIFISELKNVTNISVIGITDYFSLDGYKMVILKKSELSQFDLILPNIELRITPVTNDNRKINLHIIPNTEILRPDEIENFLYSFQFGNDKRTCKEEDLIELGKKLNAEISNEEAFQKGLNEFAISYDTFFEKYNNLSPKIKENILIGVSNSSSDGASGIKDVQAIREIIYSGVDFIFSSQPKDREHFLGNAAVGDKEQIKKIYGNLKPCLHGSDYHGSNDKKKICVPALDRFCWIKADPTFEGLKQTIYEPEDRVKIQKDRPDFKEKKLLIAEVAFISPENVFSTEPIHLNPNLNVIIGGKSSGKSILLYAIAKTLLVDDKVLKNDGKTEKYDFNKIEAGFDFQITTEAGFKQNLKRKKDENSILPEIKYIPQNYLVKLAESAPNEEGKCLNKLIQDLIMEDNNSKDRYQEFLEKVNQNNKLRKECIDRYFETQKEIQGLDAELKTKSNKLVLERNIQTNQKQIQNLNESAGFTPEEIEKYKKLQDKLEDNNTKHQKFNADFLIFKNFNNELIQAISNLKQGKDVALRKLQLQEIKDFYQRAYSDMDALLEEANKIVNKIKTSIEVQEENGTLSFIGECKFGQVLNAIKGERVEINKSIQPYLENEQRKKAVEDLNRSIANDKKTLEDIETLSKKIQEKNTLLMNTKEEIFRIYEANYQEYVSIIKDLKDRTSELEKDGLGVVGKAQYNCGELHEKLYNISDGRTASYNKYSISSYRKEATYEADFETVLKEVKGLFDDLINKEYTLTNKNTIQSAIEIVLDNYFLDYWEINYKNDKLGEMSAGKASFVILMLIIGLSKSKAPILIDQPEDNLDNRSITTDLVGYLRKKKLERQIIIITHNPNIVVNADAENIIVANQKGQSKEELTSPFRFDYINGAIENSFDKINDEKNILKSMGIKQHITDIVEGGKDAFIMREKKYSLKQ